MNAAAVRFPKKPRINDSRRRTEVQAIRSWTPPTGTLGGIVAEAHERARLLVTRERELRRGAGAAPAVPVFSSALRQASVGLIAEVKRRSPSKGWINPHLSAPEQARAYQSGGAAAVSVLTEPRHFGGSNADLESVRDAVRIPTLKKDFHVAPLQLMEAKALGASAALVIARAVAPHVLTELLRTAREVQLEVLVEIRDEDELTRALAAGARIIGINNRNLETLEIDQATSERLLSRVPRDVVAVAESGVSLRVDIERVAARGADGVLVGSVISAAADPVATVRALVGVPRIDRDT